MSGREDIESSPTVNKVLPRNVRTNPVGGGAHDAPVWRNSNFVGGHSICPRCMEFHSNTRRRTPEPALCKGRCRAERGTGVVPDTNYLLFLFCKLQAFTIPQALARQLPLHKGALGLCEHCKLTCGASWAPPPTGFVRTLRVRTLPTAGATNGRPPTRRNPIP